MRQQESHVRAVRLRRHGLIGACSVAATMAATLIATPSTAAPTQNTANYATSSQASPASQQALSLMRKAASSRATIGDLANGRTRMSATSVTPNATVTLPAEGSFVSYQNKAYRIVGGATLYVSSWTPFGGKQKVTAITTAQWNALRVMPKDGTFVRAMPGGSIYRVVAGAPIYVSTWAAFGGPQARLDIDAADVTHAGQDAPWDGLSSQTLDFDGVLDGNPTGPSVFVKGGQTGQIYKMVGGSPVYVQSWAAYGGAHAYTVVDQNAIDNAGQAGNYRFVLKHPMNDWPIRDGQGKFYVIAGGAPIYLPTASLMDGITPSLVASNDLGQMTSAAPYDNLLFRPLSPTYLRGVQSGSVYQVLDGVPHYLASWSYVGGTQTRVDVDQLAIDNAGTGGAYNHLLPLGTPVPAP